MKKIAIGSDHGGFDLKQYLAENLRTLGYQVDDVGCDSKISCDYPVFGHAVARKVAAGEDDFGIVICTSGIGMSISANKVPGIRAALCSNAYMARMARLHNNANVLALGAAIVGEGMAKVIVDEFLHTDFSNGERHIRRLDEIEKIEV